MTTKLTQTSGVVWEVLDDQALLVHTSTGARWMLNAAAVTLWQLCDGTRTLESLSQMLAVVTRRNQSDCRRESEYLAHALLSTGLLQGSDGMKQPAAFSAGGSLPVRYMGISVNGPRRRASPRGNSGPG